MNLLWWKHLLVRTPFEGLAKRLRYIAAIPRRLRHPELAEIYAEPRRIEAAMRRLITLDANCIDVGCHIGSTLSLIVKLAPQGKHTAFEPLPQKAAWLRRKFPEVDVRQMALSNVAGTVDFTENLDRPGFSGLRQSVGSRDRVRHLAVACDRLDHVLHPDYRVDFLKLDVEGAEQLVLEGASAVLRRNRPAIVFESGPGGADQFGLTRHGLYSLLVDRFAYHVYFLKGFLEGKDPIDWETFDAAHRYPFNAFNYVAINSP
jgi:FkbM family methyltransferase